MTFGNKQSDRYGEVSRDTAFAIMDHFYNEGGNFIDTANAYQYGQSEEWVGEWMETRQNRDEIVLATKYSAGYLGDKKDKIQSNTGGNGSKSMKVSLEASLRKLKTGYIDLFYVHWWDYTVSIPELMHSLNDLIVAGKVLYSGISDSPAWVVSKANQYARDHGLRQFVVYQGMWNASMRDFEREIIPMCRDEGMGLCPYGVLNQGRFQTEQGFKEREKHNPGRNFIPLSEHDKKVSRALETVAERKGTPLLHIALAYVMQKTTYVFPIVGGRKIEHIAGSIDALSVALSKEEMDEIETAYEFDPGFPHTFLSGTLFSTDDPRGGYGPDDVMLTKILGQFDWVERPRPIMPAQAQRK
jgi:aryl-alcohol dehydrogenase-like predicted oxidoreductase